MRSLPALALPVLASCGGGGDTPATPSTPAALVALATTPLVAVAGSALASPVAVRVTTTDGRAVSNASLAFSVTAGGGSVTGSPARTNAAGESSVVWTLGKARGVNALTVSVPGAPALTITATGVAGPTAALALVTPAVVTGRAGDSVSASARVVDANGNPTPRIFVLWTNPGQGSRVAISDTNGVASHAWRLAAGSTTLTVTTEVPLPPVQLTAIGTAP